MYTRLYHHEYLLYYRHFEHQCGMFKIRQLNLIAVFQELSERRVILTKAANFDFSNSHLIEGAECSREFYEKMAKLAILSGFRNVFCVY